MRFNSKDIKDLREACLEQQRREPSSVLRLDRLIKKLDNYHNEYCEEETFFNY